MKNSPVYCWDSDGCGWIRVVGAGCFLNATQVKEFGKTMIARGAREFVVDLAECTGLDSTFMGTLAKIALDLRGLGAWENAFRIEHVSAELREEFEKLGLEGLFRIQS